MTPVNSIIEEARAAGKALTVCVGRTLLCCLHLLAEGFIKTRSKSKAADRSVGPTPTSLGSCYWRGCRAIVGVFWLRFGIAGRDYVGFGEAAVFTQSTARDRNSRLFTQLFQDILTIDSGILAGKSGKRLGQDVMMMQSLKARLARNVKPQPVYQVNVFRLQRRRMRADVEGVHFLVRIDHL